MIKSQELLDNLKMNCVSIEMLQLSIDGFTDFLMLKRKPMAKEIKGCYFFVVTKSEK